MTLRQRQSKFAHMIALLIIFAYEQGYELTFGDAWSKTYYNMVHWFGGPSFYANVNELHEMG